ncbi:Hint domain-containing protein [uncultured Roseobacter sp.]|uniref:Hint domain-containing protein n=1 Tax=uncultured Roseobacter sp. TaxID=114847 RepID=UPI0026297AB3|nr:Hint domain-containing protein [uncultured Roseobacter sp.]
MAGYISEFQYYGNTSQEFIEVALPAGTDPSGYAVHIYGNDGSIIHSFPIGTSTGTMGGHDVYVIDAATPGFNDGGSDPTGNMYPDDALALVNGSGDVEQFVSYWGNTVTATQGPASGMTSSDVGTAGPGESLQSDNGGSSYYTQSSPNSGSIPACYAPGSLISTPAGAKPVEALVPGDLVLTTDGAVRPIRWIWSGTQPLEQLDRDQKPVLIRAGALGPDLPSRDLIVSAQHRIVVGAFGQLQDIFDGPYMVPAKALTGMPGIRFMPGKRSIVWHHFLCDDHCIVFANALASESLLLGAGIVGALRPNQLEELSQLLSRPITSATREQPALPCLTVGQTKKALARRKHIHNLAGGQRHQILAMGGRLESHPPLPKGCTRQRFLDRADAG